VPMHTALSSGATHGARFVALGTQAEEHFAGDPTPSNAGTHPPIPPEPRTLKPPRRTGDEDGVANGYLRIARLSNQVFVGAHGDLQSSAVPRDVPRRHRCPLRERSLGRIGARTADVGSPSPLRTTPTSGFAASGGIGSEIFDRAYPRSPKRRDSAQS
jgi:hypothetical protein